MSLSEHQKRQLRKLGHHLKPVVMIGANGLTEAVCNEADLSLAHHELLKVKVNAADRDERDAIIASLCERCAAELVQRVGHVALVYRRNPENPKIHLER
ncbi:RNA-binding protein [Candidatus Tenderia electrophaga]|jgi:RNA-binding protein|uniref:RNA-binding protein n=1 Tax=Candidatus Tenderia electrophaga TaxID=1748243 RepID=A0A0S2TCD2_9GAMM|nr:RNA-binding protein [Candidatus Tenderia electrophaga]